MRSYDTCEQNVIKMWVKCGLKNLSWHAMKDSNPPPQFSRLGTWCPTFFCTSVLFVSCMYLDGGMGGGGWLLTSFFSIIYILGLVCYKHTIHVYIHVCSAVWHCKPVLLHCAVLCYAGTFSSDNTVYSCLWYWIVLLYCTMLCCTVLCWDIQ